MVGGKCPEGESSCRGQAWRMNRQGEKEVDTSDGRRQKANERPVSRILFLSPDHPAVYAAGGTYR